MTLKRTAWTKVRTDFPSLESSLISLGYPNAYNEDGIYLSPSAYQIYKYYFSEPNKQQIREFFTYILHHAQYEIPKNKFSTTKTPQGRFETKYGQGNKQTMLWGEMAGHLVIYSF